MSHLNIWTVLSKSCKGMGWSGYVAMCSVPVTKVTIIIFTMNLVGVKRLSAFSHCYAIRSDGSCPTAPTPCLRKILFHSCRENDLLSGDRITSERLRWQCNNALSLFTPPLYSSAKINLEGTPAAKQWHSLDSVRAWALRGGNSWLVVQASSRSGSLSLVKFN